MGAHSTDDPSSTGTPSLTLKQIIGRFWVHTASDRLKLLAAFLFMAASTACDTVVVTMFARIVDGATTSHSMDAVWPAAIQWMVLTAVGGVLSVIGGWLMVGAAERFVFRLRHAVFAHLQRLGPSFFGHHATGDLISRLSTDIDAVEGLASSGIVSTVIAVGTAIAYAAAAVVVQWQLALIVVALAPLMWVTSRITGRFTRTAARVERAAAGEVGTAIQQSLQNLPLVQAYGTEHVESARLDHHGEVWWRARARESRLQMIYSPITTLIQSGALLAVLIAGAAFIASGELTVGGLFGFAAYLGYLYPPLSQLGSLHLTVTSASASCERLVEILDADPEVTDAPDADDSPVRRGRLELRDVRYVYPGTAAAGLAGVSLDVQPGQFVLVTGPSGAGKSTLTRMLLRFVDAQAGAILLDGVDVRDRTVAAVRRAVTLLPQKPMLFDLTVAENIAYARPDASPAEIEAAARDAGALEFIRELPHGFDTIVGEDGATLSGGQRQRLAIARALLRTSPILVLDEPVTGLDAPTARAVLDPLRRLSDGRTTIVVSHDLTPALEADLVVVLDEGRIVAQGRHDDLLARSGVYASLWAAQSGAKASLPDEEVVPSVVPRPVPPRRPEPVAAGGATRRRHQPAAPPRAGPGRRRHVLRRHRADPAAPAPAPPSRRAARDLVPRRRKGSGPIGPRRSTGSSPRPARLPGGQDRPPRSGSGRGPIGPLHPIRSSSRPARGSSPGRCRRAPAPAHPAARSPGRAGSAAPASASAAAGSRTTRPRVGPHSGEPPRRRAHRPPRPPHRRRPARPRRAPPDSHLPPPPRPGRNARRAGMIERTVTDRSVPAPFPHTEVDHPALVLVAGALVVPAYRR